MTLDPKGLEAGRSASRNHCCCTPPDCNCDERADDTITAYLSAVPSDVSGLVERLERLRDDLKYVGEYDGLVTASEAATALSTLSARPHPNETLERAAKVADEIAGTCAEGWRNNPKLDGCGGEIAASNTGGFIAAAIRQMKEPE